MGRPVPCYGPAPATDAGNSKEKGKEITFISSYLNSVCSMQEKIITATRVFNAPVASVWRIWTDPEMVRQWWGPERFTCPFAKIDFREGGTSLVSMKGPEGSGFNEVYSVWSYRKIVPMERIEFIQNLADREGNKMKPTALGMPPDFPEDILTIVTFNSLEGNRTEMTVTEYADMGQMAHFAQLGLDQSMDKIVALFA
jgi:uncharacterized protein YndB with AHSA1/START domain